MTDKERLAAKLAGLLRELADACEQAARGDRGAQQFLEGHTDGYWRGLVVGNREVERLWGKDDA